MMMINDDSHKLSRSNNYNNYLKVTVVVMRALTEYKYPVCNLLAKMPHTIPMTKTKSTEAKSDAILAVTFISSCNY